MCSRACLWDWTEIKPDTVRTEKIHIYLILLVDVCIRMFFCVSALRAVCRVSCVVMQVVNTIRVLAADIVQKSMSGHPGAPMGCAPMAHVLFNKVCLCL